MDEELEQLMAQLEQAVYAGYERSEDVTARLIAHLTLCLATRSGERLGQLLVNALRLSGCEVDQETLWRLTDEEWIELLTTYGMSR